MGTLSHITDDGPLLNFDASSGSTQKFVECSDQFSCRKTLVEKSFCKYGMSRRNSKEQSYTQNDTRNQDENIS